MTGDPVEVKMATSSIQANSFNFRTCFIRVLQESDRHCVRQEIPCLLRNPAVYHHIHKNILPNAGGMYKNKQKRCLCTDVKHWFVFMRNEICGNSNEVSVRTRPPTNRLYNEVTTFRQQTLPPTYCAFNMKPLAFITDSEGVEYLFSGNTVFIYLELTRDLACLYVKEIDSPCSTINVWQWPDDDYQPHLEIQMHKKWITTLHRNWRWIVTLKTGAKIKKNAQM